MGTVLLTGWHRNLGGSKETATLDVAWLAQPFPFGEDSRRNTQAMLEAMLWALVDLKGVNSSLSLGVTTDHLCAPCLQISGRMWGLLWIDKPSLPILRFTHDSRFDNHPFMHLYQWLEDEWPTGLDWDSPDYAATCKLWQDRNKWLDFFERRLAREVEALREQATDLHVAGWDKFRLAKKIAER